MIRNPEDRLGAAMQYIEAVGGELHSFCFALGDHDAYAVWETPDNVALAATALAITSGGALSAHHSTVLLGVKETIATLQKAATIAYRGPGGQ
jgi:uncharacterized protein with GYD domain